MIFISSSSWTVRVDDFGLIRTSKLVLPNVCQEGDPKSSLLCAQRDGGVDRNRATHRTQTGGERDGQEEQ